jgi:hypothetical protein
MKLITFVMVLLLSVMNAVAPIAWWQVRAASWVLAAASAIVVIRELRLRMRLHHE